MLCEADPSGDDVDTPDPEDEGSLAGDGRAGDGVLCEAGPSGDSVDTPDPIDGCSLAGGGRVGDNVLRE